jgi:hypothetical protein
MEIERSTILVALAAAALGFGAARLTAAPSRDHEIVRMQLRQLQQTDELGLELAAMKAQLQQLRDRPAPVAIGTGTGTDPGTGAKAAFPGSEQALGRGRQLLARAIATHIWGPAEIGAMRKLMAEMNGEAHLEMSQAVATAINRGDIKGRISQLLAGPTVP